MSDPQVEPHPSGIPADQRQWAMFAHLSSLAGGLVGGWGWFIGPLLIWLMKKETMPFVAEQAREALNFSITVTGVFAILWLLTVLTLGIGGIIAVPLMFLGGLGALVLVIMAAIKSNEGVSYRYPFAVRLVK